MDQPKILFICLGAYKYRSAETYDEKDRQDLYAVALHGMLRRADKNPNIHLIVIDNTVSSKDELSSSLTSLYGHPAIKDLMLINNNTLGSKSKGAGEYVMCQAVVEKHRELLKTYDWVVYYTSRQVLCFPVFIDEMNTNPTEDILICNPPYHFSDGSKILSAPLNYNDMIFAMKPTAFLGYVDSMNPEKLAKDKMNSEAWLYHYVHTSNLPFKELSHAGVLRFDYAMNKMQVV